MEICSEYNFFLLLFLIFVILWIIQFPGLGKKIFGEESNEFTNDLGKYKNLNVFYNLIIIGFFLIFNLHDGINGRWEGFHSNNVFEFS